MQKDYQITTRQSGEIIMRKDWFEKELEKYSRLTGYKNLKSILM